MSDSAKDLNRKQFGANAANYVASHTHAKGASLQRMVELVEPQAHWQALDIATAAGHTAFAFAPHVAAMTASDLTEEMVALATARSGELEHHNVSVKMADAEALPFDDGEFDLVTCRIAPHHFPNPDIFIQEVARVLRSGGVFCMVDNVVPDDAEVATFCDDWERRRDPSHIRCLPISEWTDLCVRAGLTLAHSETAPKRMVFKAWADNMNVAHDDRPGLLDDLYDASAEVKAFLRPEGSTQDDTAFYLTEGLILATR